jgi:O-antigen/teichoic acid export membrane protein
MVAGGKRATLTATDQVFSSLSNFALVVVVARLAGSAGLGAFSFAYGCWLILASLHRSLVTDLMAIENDVWAGDAKARIRKGMGAEVALGSIAAVLLALGGGVLSLLGLRAFSIAMLALAPWLPFLVVQDYWRWVGFMSARPARSLTNDLVFNVVQAAAFAAVFVTGVRWLPVVIWSWGLGAAAGALFGLRQYGVRPSTRGGAKLLRERWSLGKWLAGTSLVNFGGQQLYMLLVGVILGPAGLGALKAAQNLVMGPAGVLVQAGGSVGLPEATKAYSEKGWQGLRGVARWVTRVGLVSCGALAAVAALWGGRLLADVYGPQFAHLRVAAILIGFSLVWIALMQGPEIMLKATRRTSRLFIVQVLSFGISIAGVACFAPLYGVNGAALSVLVTSIGVVAALKLMRYRVGRDMVGDAHSRVSAPSQATCAPEGS